MHAGLTLPGRRLADGRALSDLFEEGWLPVLASIRAQIAVWQRAEDELGPQTVLRLLALHGSRTESVGDWWGSGWYETLARRVIDKAARVDAVPATLRQMFPDQSELVNAVAHSPDLPDDDALRWLTQAIFDEQSARRAADEPNPTAITLPDWAADELAELLETSGDDIEPST